MKTGRANILFFQSSMKITSVIFFVFITAVLISPIVNIRFPILKNDTASYDVLSPLLISLETSFAVVLLTFTIGFPVAYILGTKEFRGKIIFDTLIDLPISLPPLVSGLAMLMLFGSNSYTGKVLAFLNISILFTKKGIILAQFFVASPYFIKTVKEAIAVIPRNIFDAAEVLQSTRWYTCRRILIPMTKKAILSGLIMTWARAMGEFGATAMIAGAIPEYTETMTIAIYRNASAGNTQTASMIACLLMLFSFIVLVIIKGVFITNNGHNIKKHK